MHEDNTATVEPVADHLSLAAELQASLQALQGFAKRPADFDPSWVEETTKAFKGCLELIALIEKEIQAQEHRRRCPIYSWARRIKKR